MSATGLEPYLTVVLPAYNEAGCIESNLRTLAAYLGARSAPYEILVVDDGSRDGTAALVQRLAGGYPAGLLKCLVNEHNQGKGFSIRRGMLAAAGELRLFMDADLAYSLDAVDRICRELSQDADVAIGSRMVAGAEIRSGVPRIRTFSGRVFNALVQLLLFRGIPDTQCGIKGFTSQAAADLFSRQTISSFGFDVELLFIARKWGYRIVQVPVELVHYRKESRVHIWRDSLKMLRDILRVRWQSLRGHYSGVKDP